MNEKKAIKVSREQYRQLMTKFGVAKATISYALRYERNSEQAKKIRATALQMEGVQEVVIVDAKQYKELVK